ncbi:MAG: aromatic ring-hydroxylating dioxygenase subunit alpha [Alphaproteobacteria bacterium]|nr:aromatic ring-hydroxylating dioxygenase subunit alpha [Alphaproteobacteria bacterium]
MTVLSNMRSHLLQRKPGFSLEQPFYNDQAYYDLDIEYIWNRSWLFAGMTADIPKAGDYFTMQVGKSSIVVVRDQDNSINAVFNTCRHRGSKLCLKEKGNSPKLVCPYHQWTYNLDGSLLFAGNMGPEFNASEYPLKKVHLETVAGYIFVCLAENAPDFTNFRRDVEPYLIPHDLENAKVAFETTILEKANWKLVIENNRECYHCAGSHPELLNTLAEFDNTDDPRIDPRYVSILDQKAKDWDALGLPHRPTPVDLRYRAVRLPFINGAKSMTIDGSPACEKLMGNLTDRDLGSVRMLSLPNSWNHVQSDHCLAFRVLPVGPEETLVTTKWLVHKDAVEGKDYDIDKMTKVWIATNEQDRKLAEDNQQGINSIAYEPGPYSESIEFGVRNFIDWYCGEMLLQMPKEEPDLTLISA